MSNITYLKKKDCLINFFKYKLYSRIQISQWKKKIKYFEKFRPVIDFTLIHRKSWCFLIEKHIVAWITAIVTDN